MVRPPPATRWSNRCAVRLAAHAQHRPSPRMRRAHPTAKLLAAGGRRSAGETRSALTSLQLRPQKFTTSLNFQWITRKPFSLSLCTPNEGFPGGGNSPNTINVPPKARRRRRRRPARRRRSPARSPFTGPLGYQAGSIPGQMAARAAYAAPGPLPSASAAPGRGGPLSGTDQHQARQPADCA